MSNFVGLNTALSGLRAAQFGLDTSANNIANAGTDGYTRQRVGLRPSLSFPSAPGPLGTGVTITGIDRLRDGFVDARMRTALGESASQGTKALLLARTEAVMAEPETGITAALGELWDSFEDWALDPAGAATQQQVVSSLDRLTGRIRSISTGWEQLEADTDVQRTALTTDANRMLGEVAQLNRLIPVQTAIGGPPNDLLDQRDLLADRLAEAIGATVTTDDDGVMHVSVSGSLLVAGVDAPELTANGSGLAVSGGAADGLEITPGGELGSLIEFGTRDLPAQRERLDTFVTALADALHAHHGPDSDPAAPPLLASSDGASITSRTVTVNPELTADPDLLVGDKGGGPHDARNAAALAALRLPGEDGSPTLNARMDAQIVDLAGEVAIAGRAAKAEHDLAVAATVARQSAHGVSLDEEMAAVVQHQRSLEAVSRVMTAIDEALDVLINRTGVVGR